MYTCLMNDCQQTNWVATRAACFVPHVFGDLAEVVRRDMEEANRVSPLLMRGFSFFVSPNPEKQQNRLEVRRSAPSSTSVADIVVTFTMTTEAVRIDCPAHPNYPKGFFHVRPTWNPSEGLCSLQINGHAHDLWQISQEALGYLIFPQPPDEAAVILGTF